MSTPEAKELEAYPSGTSVLRTQRGRETRWIKQDDGAWKLDARKVWLTAEELAGQPVRFEADGEDLAAMKTAVDALAAHFAPGGNARWEEIVQVAAPFLLPRR